MPALESALRSSATRADKTLSNGAGDAGRAGSTGEPKPADSTVAACGPNGALSVNYNALTSLLIEAVKQQGRELEELRSELKALREQVRP